MRLVHFSRLRAAWLLLVVLLPAAQAGQTEHTLLAHIGPASVVSPNLRDKVSKALEHLDQRLALHPADHEASLLKGLVHFRNGDIDAALRELDALRQRAPTFHLAHLVYADMLLARFKPVDTIGGAQLFSSLDQNALNNLIGLQEEARYRLRVHLERDWHNRIPRQILAVGESVQHVLLVDKSSHRLYLFEQQGQDKPPRLVSDFYVSTGRKQGNKNVEGDLRTPEGVYFVTSWIPDSRLPDRYGIGAFPVDYPNAMDRRLGKTGYGIWLHGTESGFYSRPPLDSEGCVVLANYDLKAIKHEIRPGVTPVIIAPHIDWVDEASWMRERQELLAVLQQWRKDWESLDVERYLSHYDENFWTSEDDLSSWQQRKRAVAAGKNFQQVNLTDISLFMYPQGDGRNSEMVVARLHQDYQSNNFNSSMYKRLYLNRAENGWRILYEGR